MFIIIFLILVCVGIVIAFWRPIIIVLAVVLGCAVLYQIGSKVTGAMGIPKRIEVIALDQSERDGAMSLRYRVRNNTGATLLSVKFECGDWKTTESNPNVGPKSEGGGFVWVQHPEGDFRRFKASECVIRPKVKY